MKNSLFFAVLAALLFTSCESTPEPSENETDVVMDAGEDKIVNSFVFVGCNRLWWKDVDTLTSSANANVLKNIFKHVSSSKIKTDYFFFLGDIVNGETDTATLNQQLSDWNKEYDAGKFSDFKSTGIQLIAVPGNHEMLYNSPEIPLKSASEVWMKHMRKYTASNAEYQVGISTVIDSMSYAFTDGNIGFVVLNTDTYNTNEQESVIPYDWVKKQVAKYKNDPALEHVFVMGHRPFYTNCLDYGDTLLCPEDNAHECIRNTTHSGVRYPGKSNPVWQSFEDNNVISMLSAHVHQYQRLQPNQKTYQLVAGNGGSPLDHKTPPKFFGYARINIWASGRVEMISEGYDAPFPYNRPIDPLTNKDTTWAVRDSLYDMNWYKKGAKNADVCECVTGE